MSRIRLSEKHGVNPSLLVCWYCGKDSGVALVGRLPGDAEAPRKMMDREPCDECRGYMQQGVILIGVDESKTTDTKNPYRSGRFAVMRADAVRRIFDAASVEQILKHRCAFLTNDAWDLLGIPVGE